MHINAKEVKATRAFGWRCTMSWWCRLYSIFVPGLPACLVRNFFQPHVLCTCTGKLCAQNVHLVSLQPVRGYSCQIILMADLENRSEIKWAGKRNLTTCKILILQTSCAEHCRWKRLKAKYLMCRIRNSLHGKTVRLNWCRAYQRDTVSVWKEALWLASTFKLRWSNQNWLVRVHDQDFVRAPLLHLQRNRNVSENM